MKLINLTMIGFGPYANKECIDFTVINNFPIFLIHGSTGSGKTTILDGISFALYGESSGGKFSRESKSLRSQFADENIDTTVILEFKLNTKQYRVTRTPEYTRKAKRGDGYVVSKPTAVIEMSEDNKYEVIETGTTRVSLYIEKLIGFNYNQFSQVLMIPQMQFRKLLLSDSNERKDILKKIFNTNYYSFLQRALKENAKILKESILNVEKEQVYILKQFQFKDEALVDRINEGNVNYYDVKEYIDKYLEEHKQNEEILEKEIKVKEDLVEIEEKKLQQSRELYNKFIKREEIDKQLIVLNKNEDNNNLKRRTIVKARKALPLAVTEKYLMDQEKELNKDYIEIEKISKEIDKVSIDYKNIKNEYANLNDLEQNKLELIKHINNLNRYKEQVYCANEYINSIEVSKSNHKIVQDKKIAMEKELEVIKKQFEIKNKELENITNNETELFKIRNQIEKYERHLKSVKELEKNNSILEKNNRLLNEYMIKVNDKSKEVNDIKAVYERNQVLFLAGQAGLLAQNLEKGEKCPVCGSTAHPELAKLEENIPREEELEKNKDDIETKGKELKELNEYLLSIKQKNDFIQELIEKTNLDSELSSDIKILQNKIDNLYKNYKEIEKSKKNYQKLIEIKQNLNKKIDKLEDEYKNIMEKENNSTLKIAEIKGKIDSILSQVPKEYHKLIVIENDIISSDNKLSKLSKKIQNVKKEYEIKKEKFDKLKSLVEEKQNIYNKSKDTLDKELREFKEDIVIKSGFKDYENYLNYKLDEEDIICIEKAINEYDTKVSNLKSQLKETMGIIAGKKKPNLEFIIEVLNKNKDKLKESYNELAQIKERNNIYKIYFNNLIQNNKQLLEYNKKYALVGQLAEISNGNNPQGIDFETFILQSLLQEILDVTNERLQVLTDNRYELRIREDRGDARKKTGLDLDILDYESGMTRNVNTLSGGESFIVSLALALSMADVVQTRSGGIELDTMFIDEGFGTLDSDALDKAIKTLTSLQNKGRMIGIISHVPELKERIDAKLEVVKNKYGGGSKIIQYKGW